MMVTPLTEIGEVTSEQLDIIPAKIQVIRLIRKQYACRWPMHQDSGPADPQESTHITVSKYQDALPL